MRVLLINPNRFKEPFPVIPLGLCNVASSVEEAKYEVKLLDLCFSVDPEKKIRKAVAEWHPDIIGISVRNIDTSNGFNPVFLIERVKRDIIDPCKYLFDGPIVIGGASIGINGPEVLEYFDLEYAVSGDGESSFVEFVRRIEKKSSLKGIDGLIIRREGKIIENNPPSFIKDINKLPFARPDKYLNLFLYRLYDSPLQIQTKRGCALKCTYCTYNRIEGKTYRLRDPKLIADEIELLVRSTGIKNIEFVDSTFNIPLEHSKSILKELLKKRLRLKLSTMGLNPKSIDSELVDLMKKSGFYDVCVTVESGSDLMLRSLGKNFNKIDIIKAEKLLHKKGIPIQWFLLLGAPGESVQTLQETFDTINRASSIWDVVNIGIGIRIYNGAPISKEWGKKNDKRNSNNFFYPVAFVPKDITLEEIKLYTKKAAIKNHNYLMYDEGAGIPFLFRLFFNTIFGRQPIWKGYVFTRFLEKIFGFSYLRAKMYELKHKK